MRKYHVACNAGQIRSDHFKITVWTVSPNGQICEIKASEQDLTNNRVTEKWLLQYQKHRKMQYALPYHTALHLY